MNSSASLIKSPWRLLLFTFAVIASALLSLVPSSAQDPRRPMPFWKSFFARPSSLISPTSNSTTAEKIALGRKLFHDARLSGNGKTSCASCHQINRGYSDGGQAARKANDNLPIRDTPTLWNIGWAKQLFWDGRAATLEAQAFQPIGAAHELGANWTDILAQLLQDSAYRSAFANAFPETPVPSTASTVEALAAFQRSLLSPITRFDKWIAGDANALTNSERDGFFLFVGKAGCVGCHAGWRFTDDELYDIGLPPTDEVKNHPTDEVKNHRFKTPTLRMLNLTQPYMHDGRFSSLDDVLSHYAGKKINRPGISEKIPKQINLTAQERSNLVEFLKSLSISRTKR